MFNLANFRLNESAPSKLEKAAGSSYVTEPSSPFLNDHPATRTQPPDQLLVGTSKDGAGGNSRQKHRVSAGRREGLYDETSQLWTPCKPLNKRVQNAASPPVESPDSPPPQLNASRFKPSSRLGSPRPRIIWGQDSRGIRGPYLYNKRSRTQ